MVTQDNGNERKLGKLVGGREGREITFEQKTHLVSFSVAVSGERATDTTLLRAGKTNVNGTRRNGFERATSIRLPLRSVDGCHRPLVGTRISNPVSVITEPETSP